MLAFRVLSFGKLDEGLTVMKFRGAVFKEKSVTFVIVMVKKNILGSQYQSEETTSSLYLCSRDACRVNGLIFSWQP